MSQKEEKNAQIISAATEEFLSKGFDAASMHNIAEIAEVSKRTLYKYYPTKDDLFNALVDEVLDRIEDIYFEYNAEVSIEKQIGKVIESKMQLTLTDSFIKISKILFGELLKNRLPTQEQMQRMNRSESHFIEWIRAGQKDGKILSKLDAEDIAVQFHSLLKGQIYWPVLLGLKNRENLDLNKIKEMTVNFFVNSFTHSK